jgi:hypothetical protein
VHRHELVHVIQWRLLGLDRFLLTYANGLECFGYRQSPLEAMADDAEKAFAGNPTIFNAEKLVAADLGGALGLRIFGLGSLYASRHHSAAAVTEGDTLWMERRSRIAAGALVGSGGEAIRLLH